MSKPFAYVPKWVAERIARYGHTTAHLTKNVNAKADDYMPVYVEPSDAKSDPAPIDMILHCPNCGMQHIDKPEPMSGLSPVDRPATGWTNPPHRSHLCHGCGHIWRPADVPTNGVAAIKTKGKNDSAPRDDGMPASATERRLRRMLCASRHPMAYMDDGEASDSSAAPFIDYMRDSLDTIDAKMLQRFNNKHGA